MVCTYLHDFRHAVCIGHMKNMELFRQSGNIVEKSQKKNEFIIKSVFLKILVIYVFVIISWSKFNVGYIRSDKLISQMQIWCEYL